MATVRLFALADAEKVVAIPQAAKLPVRYLPGVYQLEGGLQKDPEQARFGMRCDAIPVSQAVIALEASKAVQDLGSEAFLALWRQRGQASAQFGAAPGFGDNVRFDSELITHLIGQFGVHHPATAGPLRFLDAGAGIGFNTQKLVNLGARVVAVDQSPEQLAVLHSLLADEHRPQVFLNDGDLLGKAFPRNSFDGILASHLLHYLSPDAIKTLLPRFHDWLKPRGVLYIQAFNSNFRKFRWFLPEYQENKRKGLPWPGFVQGVHGLVKERGTAMEHAEFVEGFADSLHAVELEDLVKVLRASDFSIEVSRVTSFLNSGGEDEIMVVAKPVRKGPIAADLD